MRLELIFFVITYSNTFICVTTTGNINLTILHTNDIHSHYDGVRRSSHCPKKYRDDRTDKCLGGEARRFTLVNMTRDKVGEENVLLLNAGDNFQGTLYYYVHKWRMTADLMNIFRYDAMALGNHEFDDGVSGLMPFLSNVTFPVVGSNLDLIGVKEMQNYIKKSVIIRKGNTNIGIVGYTTEDTPKFSKPGKVKFLDVISSLQEEVNVLKTKVNIIIAVGHAGFEKDREIAKKVDGIDIVVGGHTNTFLYDGTPPTDGNNCQGTYPTVEKSPSGESVLVVQAYKHGKYMGHLDTTFNDRGEIISWNGNPILLDSEYEKNEMVQKVLDRYFADVDDRMSEVVGNTLVYLDASRIKCRLEECNLGNLVADACVFKYLRYRGDNRLNWADTTMAIWNSGSIRASIPGNEINGTITIGDIVAALPYGDTMDLVVLKGADLSRVLEHAVRKYDHTSGDPEGDLLQVSGMKVVYDMNKPDGNRLESLDVLCSECPNSTEASTNRIPRYEPVSKDRNYTLCLPSFLANGGGVYNIDKYKLRQEIPSLVDMQVVMEYIRKRSPIFTPVDGRIKIKRATRNAASTNNSNRKIGDIIFAHFILLIISITWFGRKPLV